MSNDRPIVVYAFPKSHRFRVPFHEKLRNVLLERGIEYVYIFAPNASDDGKGDLENLGWATGIPERVFSLLGVEVVWQPLVGAFMNSDLFIVQQENRQLVNYLLIVIAKITGKRVAFFGHGRNFQASNPTGLAETWKRFWATKVHWWFGYTEETSNLLIRFGFPPDRITVFNNTIDTSSIAVQRAELDQERVEALRTTLVNGSKNVGVFVGGMYDKKRIPFLIKSARVIRNLIPDFHLLVIGGGPDAYLVEEASENWIHYLGPRFGVQKTELLELAQVWLMPGLVGLAVLDSLAYEIPMVTCALPYHSPEIAYLINGVNGVIVDAAENIDAYAHAVADILVNNSLKLKLIAGAKKTATE